MFPRDLSSSGVSFTKTLAFWSSAIAAYRPSYLCTRRSRISAMSSTTKGVWASSAPVYCPVIESSSRVRRRFASGGTWSNTTSFKNRREVVAVSAILVHHQIVYREEELHLQLWQLPHVLLVDQQPLLLLVLLDFALDGFPHPRCLLDQGAKRHE